MFRKLPNYGKRLREAGIEYKVIKNTLTSRAAKAAKIEGLDQYLSGPTAIAFGYNDPGYCQQKF